ncbi:hypothetical protein [Asticcacaulis benevestitus]|uniref:hypothetical protein n=1 Tax=Asticcacaulis benevestitus TaxID=347481 RepID=UPI000ADDF655|nr:hypothetical protein [Asticcacaulis benevestitus]
MRQANDLQWYARGRALDIRRVARVHRDPFEPILPVLEADSPSGDYRKICEEIEYRLADSKAHPIEAAEATRALLMLRLGLHLGLRQKNPVNCCCARAGGGRRLSASWKSCAAASCAGPARPGRC